MHEFPYWDKTEDFYDGDEADKPADNNIESAALEIYKEYYMTDYELDNDSQTVHLSWGCEGERTKLTTQITMLKPVRKDGPRRLSRHQRHARYLWRWVERWHYDDSDDAGGK